MKASMTTLVAVFTIGSIGLVASSALAWHGGGFGGGYGGYSSNYYPNTEYVREVSVQAPIFAPGHSLIVVLPGDSWFSISSREYGNTSVWSRIAEFNGLPQNLPLTVGMQLRLPVINPNGALSISSAPAMVAPGQGFAGGFQGQPQGFPQGNMPQGFAQGGVPQGAQFGQQGNLPQGKGFAPQGQNFAAPQGFAPQQGQSGQPQGQPHGGQFGGQGGMPQGGQFGQPGQQFAPQNGQPQSGQFGLEGGQPQGGQFAAPQGGMPQGGQFGGQPAAPQGPMNGPQGAAAEVAPPAPAAPQGDSGPAIAGGAPNGVANGQPNGPANPAPAAAGRPLPSIVIGSLMSIGGQQLGNDRGMVHLNVNGQTRMLEVVEWTASGAKVKVPADLPAGIQADLEIIRADGSIVTKDQVQLAAANR
jgi:hypothetical protein